MNLIILNDAVYKDNIFLHFAVSITHTFTVLNEIKGSDKCEYCVILVSKGKINNYAIKVNSLDKANRIVDKIASIGYLKCESTHKYEMIASNSCKVLVLSEDL